MNCEEQTPVFFSNTFGVSHSETVKDRRSFEIQNLIFPTQMVKPDSDQVLPNSYHRINGCSYFMGAVFISGSKELKGAIDFRLVFLMQAESALVLLPLGAVTHKN